MSYRFGDFELDPGTYELRRSGALLPLQPKVFDVLHYLVRNRGRVVNKAELLAQLWSGEHVGEAAISWSVSHIRRALGQQRGDKHPVETVHGRGYIFRAELEGGGPADPGAGGEPGARADGTGNPQARSPRRTLVGRDRVLDGLRAQVEETRGGRGGMTLLTGEAGIGKTRCGQELLASAQQAGMHTLNGRCPEAPGMPPLWPVAAALRTVRAQDAELTSAIGDFVRGLQTGAGGSSGDAAGAAGFLAVEAAADLLRRLAAERPTVLMLDDLHWADVGTLRMLGLLAPELRSLPLFVLATHRDGEPVAEGALQRAREQLRRHAQAVPLAPLGQQDVAALVEGQSGGRPHAQLADAIRRATGGVPLFVLDVVRSLELEHGAAHFNTLPASSVELPGLARDLLRQRLRRLPEVTLDVLGHAAVLGEQFELSLLAGLVELEPDALLEQLEPATRHGQLHCDGPHSYSFPHGVFQAVLYDDLAPRRRVGIHRRVAELLLHHGGADTRAGEVARHYYLSLPAGDAGEVMRRARTAGDEASRIFAFEDAALYYGWALEAHLFAGDPEPHTHAALLLALGAAQRAAGRTRESDHSTERAIQLALQHGLHEQVLAATRLRRPTFAMGSVPDRVSRSALETVLQQSADDSPTRVGALARLAFLPPYEPDLSRSRTMSERAVVLAEQRGEPELLRSALRARLFALSGPADVERLLATADQLLAVAGDGHFYVGEARAAQLNAYLLSGRIGDAGAVLDRMSAAVPGPHFAEANFFCQRLQAQRQYLRGDFEGADRAWGDAFERASRAGVSYARAFYRVHLFHLAVDREGPVRAIALARGILESGGAGMAQATRAGLCHVAADAGELELVRRQLPHLGDPADYPCSTGYLHALSSYAAAAAALGERPLCEQLRALLLPFVGLNTPDAMGFYRGSVAHFLGLLDVALGEHGSAAAHFERAHADNSAMGYRVGIVRTGLAHGALEAQTGHARDAHRRLRAARTEAAALGMTWAVEQADAGLSGSDVGE